MRGPMGRWRGVRDGRWGGARRWRALAALGAAAVGVVALERGLVPPILAGWLSRFQGDTCHVERVVDGDSLRVLCADLPLEVRLHCIDAPERGQAPWANLARRHLRTLASREVRIVRIEEDRFGRQVAEVFGAGPEGPLLNLEQVRSGNAAVYRRYCDDPRYEWAEREAREARLGIWSRPGAQRTPWLYRQGRPR